jgi:hypothetical protein
MCKSHNKIRLIEIDQLLKNKFDIHYKNLNGVHNTALILTKYVLAVLA